MIKKGSALLSVVIIMALTFLLTAITVDRSLKSHRRSQEVFDDMRAYYFAESLIYDVTGYINKNIDWEDLNIDNVLEKDSLNISGAPIIEDSRASSYNVELISDIVKTYEDSSSMELAYNIKSEVTYGGRDYTVIVQMAAQYAIGTPDEDGTSNTYTYIGHRIDSKRSYRL